MSWPVVSNTWFTTMQNRTAKLIKSKGKTETITAELKTHQQTKRHNGKTNKANKQKKANLKTQQRKPKHNDKIQNTSYKTQK